MAYQYSMTFRCVLIVVALVNCAKPTLTHRPPVRTSYPSYHPVRLAQPILSRPSQKYKIIRPPKFIRFPRPPPLATRLDQVVREAVALFNKEELTLKNRLLGGTDLKTPDFENVVPAILGATTAGLGDPTAPLTRQSKILNWIGTVGRSKNLDFSIQSYLSTNTARRAGLACPFVAPNTCDNGPYRTLDGTCNNLQNPLWGSAFIPFIRFLPAQYDAGFRPDGTFRDDRSRQTGVNRTPLPSARLVSNIVHASSASGIDSITNMEYTNYGQFISHEITDTPMENGFMGSKLRCCVQSTSARGCDNIVIPPVDFFRDNGRTCFGFSRTTEVTDVDCRKGQREQINIASSFIDGTSVYGHDEDQAKDLMADGGLLKVSVPNQLPLQKHPNQKAFEMGINFLKSGDEKVSEWTGLVAITTIWHREHNRIASVLAGFDRFSTLPKIERDNLIFQETRKIVIAMIQHVTYNEYIPITVGPAVMAKYDLALLTSGYFTGYNASVNPSLFNAVGTVSMRFGHSMLRDNFNLVDKNHQKTGQTLQLRKLFWRSNNYLMFENGFQTGVLMDASERCDRHLTVDLRNHMFETATGNGLDLASLNIQRGRDHGLPPYNAFRTFSSLVPATEWSTDPSKGFGDMSADTVAKFQSIYGHPDDVDVWSGGVSEIRVPGGEVGPLFADQIGHQFETLRLGDRFWYENEANGFTPERLAEIRKSSMAKIICHNVEGVVTIQPKAFKRPTDIWVNHRVDCDSLPDVNLQLWR